MSDLFARFRATYDAESAVVDGGAYEFLLWAPGDRIAPSLFRAVLVRLTDVSTGTVHTARLSGIKQYDAERSVYYLVSEGFTPTLPSADVGVYELELVSSCGRHTFRGTNTPITGRQSGT